MHFVASDLIGSSFVRLQNGRLILIGDFGRGAHRNHESRHESSDQARAMSDGAETSVDRPGDLERRRDVALIGKISQGDQAALAEFYDRYASSLYGVAVKILSDFRDAEDTLQDALVSIWRRAASYQSQLSSPFSWAVMIVRNKAIDRIRARLRTGRAAERLTNESNDLLEIDDRSAEEPTLRELRLIARKALSDLPEEQREALELAFFSGLTHEEVADRLGLPLGTVKARIRRGLIRMRKSMSIRHV